MADNHLAMNGTKEEGEKEEVHQKEEEEEEEEEEKQVGYFIFLTIISYFPWIYM